MKIIYFFLAILFLTPNIMHSQVTFTDAAPSLGLNDPGNGQGSVFLDVNGDGWLDLYLCNNGQANKLWLNSSGVSFTEQGSVFGVNYNGAGRGCSAGDFDNDGLIDIMVGNFNQNLILYKNNTTVFANFTAAAGINLPSWGGSINWFDYNNDGKLDATLGNDGIPYHYNYLFRNDNLTSFTNVAYPSGLTDSASTLSIASADIDSDGDLDIFYGSQTANVSGGSTSVLYKNNGDGSFTDITAASGIITTLYSWAADWGDFDNDGDMDLYLVNSNGVNQLFKNNGNLTFTETAASYGVADPTQGFSCGWFDYDNDGDLDLYVANASTGIDKLYRNDGTAFTDVASAAGTNDNRHSSNITLGDFNNDGFVDIYLVNNGSENRLYKSNAGNSNKWVIIKLRGVTSNRSAIGTKVYVKSGGIRQLREVQGGSGGKGQNSLPVEFGIGSASTIDSMIVRWPSGTVQSFTNVNPNTIYSLTEGGILVGLNPVSINIPSHFALAQNYPNPFNPVTKIRFDIPRDVLSQTSNAKLVVYDVTGKEVMFLVNEQLQAGSYETEFDGSKYTSGVYFYKLTAGEFSEVRKMILVK
jgi:enediyne biosynthesis protein E4